MATSSAGRRGATTTPWFDWEDVDEDLLAFTRGLVHFRRDHPVFRRRHWLVGRFGVESADYDTAWLNVDGIEMDERDWRYGATSTLQVVLNGEAITRHGDRGQPVSDDTFLLLFNAEDEARTFTLPTDFGDRWGVVLDTDEPTPPGVVSRERPAGGAMALVDHSLVVLVRLDGDDD